MQATPDMLSEYIVHRNEDDDFQNAADEVAMVVVATLPFSWRFHLKVLKFAVEN